MSALEFEGLDTGRESDGNCGFIKLGTSEAAFLLQHLLQNLGFVLRRRADRFEAKAVHQNWSPRRFSYDEIWCSSKRLSPSRDSLKDIHSVTWYG